MCVEGGKCVCACVCVEGGKCVCVCVWRVGSAWCVCVCVHLSHLHVDIFKLTFDPKQMRSEMQLVNEFFGSYGNTASIG